MLILLAAPAAGWAADAPPRLFAGAVGWAAGTVTVDADYPTGTSSVAFSAAGAPLATVPTSPDAAGTCSSGVEYRLAAATDFVAVGSDAGGAQLWSATLSLAPSAYRPGAATIALRDSRLVRPRFDLHARGERPITGWTVRINPWELERSGTCAPSSDGRVTIPSLRLPYGKSRLRVTLRNGFGASLTPRRLAYNLGAWTHLPRAWHWVLVDKRSMRLYYVIRRTHRVRLALPVAVGKPSTPTPEGYFKLGRPQAAGGPWGPIRRPLYRHYSTGLRASGYFIHGTNEPWSIGTMASHGCVRMFNDDDRLFVRVVPSFTTVLIR